MTMRTLLVVSLMLPAACSFHVSTANISKAVLARDEAGTMPVSGFQPGDTFYCLVTLSNAPGGTKVKAVWTAVAAAGVENHPLDEIEVEAGSAVIPFKLSYPEPWPTGEYKVDLYLDGKLDRTLTFSVVAAGD